MIYKLKENKKEILDYLKRIILLVVLFIPAFVVFGFIGSILSILPFEIIGVFFGEILRPDIFEGALIIFCGTCLFSAYCILKTFGFFKKTDNLNFFLALPIIILIGLISEPYFCFWLFKGIDFNVFGIYTASIILAFILHRFFNFLTKKFPNPFEKIKYYSSIEFWKSLLKKGMENKKEVLLNILRIALFCTLYAFLTPYICEHFSLEIENLSALIFLGFFLYSYLGLKLFGFFKKTDNLKFYQAFLILLILSVILNGSIRKATVE